MCINYTRMFKLKCKYCVYFILFFFCFLNKQDVSCNANSEQYPQVSYEEVKTLKDDANYLLIDVRDPSELHDDGSIPGAINIPLDDLENVLINVPASEFKGRYGRDKPEKDFNIIFSCRSGRRSQLAQEKAIALGYKNSINYSGSWLDWEEHTKNAF